MKGIGESSSAKLKRKDYGETELILLISPGRDDWDELEEANVECRKIQPEGKPLMHGMLAECLFVAMHAIGAEVVRSEEVVGVSAYKVQLDRRRLHSTRGGPHPWRHRAYLNSSIPYLKACKPNYKPHTLTWVKHWECLLSCCSVSLPIRRHSALECKGTYVIWTAFSGHLLETHEEANTTNRGPQAVCPPPVSYSFSPWRLCRSSFESRTLPPF